MVRHRDTVVYVLSTLCLDANSASLFDDIPPAADKSQPTGKRKVVDEENDESKRPKVSAQCKI